MANARIRYSPLYFGGQKFAELHTSGTAINSGDEAQYGAEGYLGHSDGAIMTKISGTAIVPVVGTNVDVLSLLKNKSYVGVGQFIGGKWVEVSMRCLSANYDTDRKTGKMEGKFEFEGGEPDVS
jgi:hypothetical protein